MLRAPDEAPAAASCEHGLALLSGVMNIAYGVERKTHEDMTAVELREELQRYKNLVECLRAEVKVQSAFAASLIEK